MRARPAEPDHGGGMPAAEAADAPSAALERSDDLVQQLAIAKYALAAGDTEQALGAIDAALSTSRESLSELSEADHAAAADSSYAGSLIRSTPAGEVSVPAPSEPPAD